jgi:hypothetical protein
VKYGIAFLTLALAILVILPLTAIAEQSEGGIPMSSGSAQFNVHHVLLAQLGEEHLANAVLRRGTKGEYIVCWGDRILQWDVAESAEMVEVFPPIPRFQYSNGGCVMDVDGDGEEELIVARCGKPSCGSPELFWFKQVSDSQSWVDHQIANPGGEAWSAPHDILPITMEVPGRKQLKGVAVLMLRRELIWYEVPDDPETPWNEHKIGVFPVPNQSGMVLGDIAGNGRPDLACGMFWAECPADPTTQSWQIRRFGKWDDNDWGGMAKLQLGDMDGDGVNEIIASEAEIENARLGIFKRDAAHPDALWEYHEIDTGLYCPHSLVLADVDNDGRLDIIVGEMTAGGWSFPLHENPRVMAYINHGDYRFERVTLVEGWGVHEMGVASGRRDGKVLIYAADEIQPQKFSGMNTHVSYWTIERDLRSI